MSPEERENGPKTYVPRIEFTQVKQKFGALVIYYSPQVKDDYLRGLVRMTTSVSIFTCEECGNRGSLNKKGWINCLCDKCRFSTERWKH